jgi:hypothetical protein
VSAESEGGTLRWLPHGRQSDADWQDDKSQSDTGDVTHQSNSTLSNDNQRHSLTEVASKLNGEEIIGIYAPLKLNFLSSAQTNVCVTCNIRPIINKVKRVAFVISESPSSV